MMQKLDIGFFNEITEYDIRTKVAHIYNSSYL